MHRILTQDPKIFIANIWATLQSMLILLSFNTNYSVCIKDHIQMTLHFLEVKINAPFTHGSKVETLGGQRQNEPKVVS